MTFEDLLSLEKALEQKDHLKRLHLENYSELPFSIGELRELEYLDLSAYEKHASYGWNSLTDLPASMSQLHQLKNLNLSDNGFESIPPVVGQLPSLEILRVDRNPLRHLHPSLTQLPLKVLSLEACTDLDFNSFPFLPELEELSLMSCELEGKVFPSDLAKRLPKLRSLNLMANHLTQIPSFVEELKLEDLYTESNSLS